MDNYTVNLSFNNLIEIIHQIPIQELEEWMPVKEQLPKIGEPVLITLWNKDVTIGTWYGHRWGTALCYNEDVLAWMLLPKTFNPQN